MSTLIELRDFIQHVRDEVLSAYEARPADPVLDLKEVELEVSFTVTAGGGGKGKLIVLDLEGQVSAERAHKVTLRLTPIPRPITEDLAKRLGTRMREGANFPVAGIAPKHFDLPEG